MVIHPRDVQEFKNKLVLMILRNISFKIFILLGIYFFNCNLSFGYDDVHVSWKELESEHFIIHFPETHEDFARRALSIAEEAHDRLSPLLALTPKEKTHIGITDNRDEANGFARTVPQNEIRLLPYPPALSDELGLFDDWVRQLIYHEYTHILHMDTASGLHDVLNVIFGKFARNNATAPRWYTEGLAVYYETRLSNSGRLRNALYRTMLRNAALDHVIPSLGALSAGTRHWPGDSGYYLYGSFFIAYLAETYGSESLTKWNHEYGDDWIPYAMNRAALKVWGKTWDDLYEEWKASVISAFEKEYEQKRIDLTDHLSLMKPWRHTMPQVLPSGDEISYVRSDGVHIRSIVRRNLKTQKEETLFECWGTCTHRWNHDASLLYFMHMPVENGYRQFERLYVYDIKENRIQLLDLPARVRSFDIEGDNLYFVVQDYESNILYQYSPAKGTLKECYRGRPFEQIENIAVKNHIIAASVFEPEQMHANIKYMDETGWHTITEDDYLEISPFWMNDHQIGYVSDRGGELNLYSIDISSGISRRLTNLLDGIMHPAISPNGDIYYTQYTSQGTTIGKISGPLDPDLKQEWSDSDNIPPLYGRGGIEYPPLYQAALSPLRDYRPWHWLWPLTWTPNFSYSEEELATIGLNVQANDISEHHSYSLGLNYLSGKNAVDLNFSYLWSGALWHLNLNFGMLQNTAHFVAGTRSIQYDYQSLSADIATSRSWSGRIMSQAVSFSYHLNYLDSSDKISWSKRDPMATPVKLPSLGWKNALKASWGWSYLRQGERALFSNDGYTLRGSLRFEAPWIGADAYAMILEARASAAWTMPYGDAHQFNMSLSGGGTWSEDTERMPFTISSSQGLSLGTSDVMMHGYPMGLLYGRHYLYGHASYSALIREFALGSSTLPAGINRLGIQGFGEWGYTWNEDWDISRSKFAIGANLIVDVQLGYRLPLRLLLGYAWGGAPRGGHAFYLLWGY